MTDDRIIDDSKMLDRRQALKRATAAGAIAGAAWAAPAIKGMTIVPGYAAAAGNSQVKQLVYNGTAQKSLGCFSGAFGTTNQFAVTLGTDGWWNFYFQGCSLGSTESVALRALSPHAADAFQPPTGYKCKFQLVNGPTVLYDTGYVTNPINGIADTGGVIFIGVADYPNGFGDMAWRIICDPI